MTKKSKGRQSSKDLNRSAFSTK